MPHNNFACFPLWSVFSDDPDYTLGLQHPVDACCAGTGNQQCQQRSQIKHNQLPVIAPWPLAKKCKMMHERPCLELRFSLSSSCNPVRIATNKFHLPGEDQHAYVWSLIRFDRMLFAACLADVGDFADCVPAKLLLVVDIAGGGVELVVA